MNLSSAENLTTDFTNGTDTAKKGSATEQHPLAARL
jgi:hypothetical protein